MTRKIFLFILLCMTCSFATWSYFPLQGSGFDAKASYVLGTGDGPQAFLLNGRWHNKKFEISIQDYGVVFSSPAGLTYPTVGAKVQILSQTALFLDLTLPLGSREEYPSIHVGAQQAFILTRHLAWAAELGYENFLKKSKVNPASTLNFGTEVDFNFTPALIFFVGTELIQNLSGSEVDQEEYYYDYTESPNDGWKTTEDLFFGASWKPGKHFAIEEEIRMKLFGTGTYSDISYWNFKTSAKFYF